MQLFLILRINNYSNNLQNETSVTTPYPCVVATDHAISIFVQRCWLCNCTTFQDALIILISFFQTSCLILTEKVSQPIPCLSLYRLCLWSPSKESLCTLYKAFIRPILTYASQAGFPSHLLPTSPPWRGCIDLPVE